MASETDSAERSEGILRSPREALNGGGLAAIYRRVSIEALLVSVALLLVVGFYSWTVWANNGFEDWGDQDYYRLLVRGWRKGQLALDKEPSRELLALKDPYDPAQNSAHRLGDASFYRGKYYLYFGAAPALTLMLPYSLVTGREMTTGAAVLVFCVAAFGAASGLWLAMRRRYFPRSAMILAPLGVLALGFGTHLLALAQRPAFWELPIAGGIAFTLLALTSVQRAIHGRRPQRAMAAAGLFLGLAVASRPTCLLAAPMLLAPLWRAWRERRGQTTDSWWRLMLAAGLPLGACGLALMAHNFARFGNVLEFGQHYQLSGAYEGKLVHFSPRFVAHNIAVYFFQPVQWSWSFPFVAAQGIQVAIPGYFGTEEVSGLAVTLGFAWFVLGVPLAWTGRGREERRALSASMAAVAGCLAPVSLLLLSYFSTTSRYQADFAVLFGVLALVGMLAVERAAQRVGRGVTSVRVLAVVLGVLTVGMGALLSLDYHGRALSRLRPELWSGLAQHAESALGRVGLWLGQFDGPRVLKVRFRPQPAGTTETFWRATDPRADERIVVEHLAERRIRFGYARGAAPVQWGRPLQWETAHTHTVDVQLPSLYHPPHGWMRGLRRATEFRERSGVAVWFSGGRALDVVTEPWPADITPGGIVADTFSGELRAKPRVRLFRADEVRDERALVANQTRGGTLRLHVVLPDEIAPEGEPLFAAGVHYGSDMVFVRPAPGGLRIGFEHYGAPQVESAIIPSTRGPRVIELVLPSCRRGDQAFGAYASGDVIVRIDGREVIRSPQSCYGFAPGSEGIGRNAFGTTCGPQFRGWILMAEWDVGS